MMSNAHDKAKLAQLIEIEGYESAEEFAGGRLLGCGLACHLHERSLPLQLRDGARPDAGYCEECGTQKMKEPVLAVNAELLRAMQSSQRIGAEFGAAGLDRMAADRLMPLKKRANDLSSISYGVRDRRH
jgi:hypothetical protein